MVEILKASAGSGKTYTLAQRYIKLLLEAQDRYAYRHILAVTFTNKATDEMKSRILEELHVLASDPQSSPYLKDFVPTVCPDTATLQNTAREILCNILHDYGAFAVSTIDGFIQHTLKAFSREIGQFASYQVELDRESLIKESVDRLLDSLTQDDVKKLNWFTSKTLSMIENGEGYKLEGPLLGVAKRLKSEEHRALVERHGLNEDTLYSEESLEALSKGTEKVMESYVADLVSAVSAIDAAFAAAGLSMSDLSGDFMNKYFSKVLKMKPGNEVPMPTDAFLAKVLADDKKCWFRKADQYKAVSVDAGVENAISAFLDLIDTSSKVYNTALLLHKQVYGFGIAADLYREFSALLKEKNVMSIDDSNTLLKNLIDGTDAPFIYEKLGVRYEHFLLDEFQDTSRVHWDNFRPLLLNSIANGFYSLIVGDVKQSIYRFRDSDWKLLRDEVKDAFIGNVTEDTLKNNWRSMANIVNFNNSFFNQVAERLDTTYGFEKEGEISAIYADVKQTVAKNGEGEVLFTFCPSDQEVHEVLSAVRSAIEKGFSYGDVAVLVRNKDEGSLIAMELISQKISVITDDSLLVSSALTVRRLVSVLSSIDNPDDTMARYLACHLSVEVPQSYDSLTGLCEDLLRKLKEYDEDSFNAEVIYVQSFMDIVQDFVASNGNSLHAFLKSWEGNTQSISSPSAGDAVRIMTIHKSKGLAFRYVIVPFVENIGLFRHGSRWCRPAVEGTALEGVATGVYDVTLSGKSEQTLFAPDYRAEVLMQYVDNINVAYVAFTRAVEVMHLISVLPDEGASIKNFSGLLYDYVRSDAAAALNIRKLEPAAVHDPVEEEDGSVEVYRVGEPHVAVEKKEKASDVQHMDTEFCSWPMCGRLTLSSDAFDFFAEDGSAGAEASNRIKGVILHDILSDVKVASDLETALSKAVSSGVLAAEQFSEVHGLMKERIAQATEWGWFPDKQAEVYNEVTLIDTDGSICRPDRVVVVDGKVTVIDYKFGEHYGEYEKKLRKYAQMWMAMGYADVTAYLWYVQTGDVKKVV